MEHERKGITPKHVTTLVGFVFKLRRKHEEIRYILQNIQIHTNPGDSEAFLKQLMAVEHKNYYTYKTKV